MDSSKIIFGFYSGIHQVVEKYSLHSIFYHRDGPKCLFRKADIGATDSGYKSITKGDENALQEAVATVGPISVGIDASQMSFQLYNKGVYYEPG